MVDGNIHDTLGNLLNNLFKCEKVTKVRNIIVIYSFYCIS